MVWPDDERTREVAEGLVENDERFNDRKRLWLRYTARETFLCQIRLRPVEKMIYAKTAELGGKMTKGGTLRRPLR